MVLLLNGHHGLHVPLHREQEVELGMMGVQSIVLKRKKTALLKDGLDGLGVPTGVDLVSKYVVGNVEVTMDCIAITLFKAGKGKLVPLKSFVTLVAMKQ